MLPLHCPFAIRSRERVRNEVDLGPGCPLSHPFLARALALDLDDQSLDPSASGGLGEPFGPVDSLDPLALACQSWRSESPYPTEPDWSPFLAFFHNLSPAPPACPEHAVQG